MGSRDAEARRAGELIYQSLSLTRSSGGSRLGIPWDNQACCGIMSPVRRTFCLVVAFDLILTFVVWAIYTQLLPKTGTWDEFIKEVVRYTFTNSMFDTVLCAACRFVPLQLAYALFRIRNPWVVAVTTGGSTAFVIAKVFKFNFSTNHNNVLCYLILIMAMVIAWTEAWLLDFKVLPREEREREREGLTDGSGERAPLLGNHGNRGRNYGRHGNHLRHDVNEYYSPHEQSPQDSDAELSPFHSVPASRTHSRQSSGSFGASLGNQEKEYIQRAQESWDTTWEILHNEDGWKKEIGSDVEEGLVYSKHFPKTGKVFKLEVIVDAPKEDAFELLVLKCDDQPKWNATLLEARTIQSINDSTDIYYTIAAEAAGGLVSSRDFVSLRHWETRDDIIVSAGCAVMHPDMPVSKKHVRGENRPGGWIFKPVPKQPNKCMFCWIINTDLKGWIPQYAVDQALSGTLLDFTKHMKKQLQVLQQNGRS